MATTRAELIEQLALAAVTLSLDIIGEIRADQGREPTLEEVKAKLQASVAQTLAEGEAWRQSKGL